VRLLDLFSGIGGFSLAAQWVWGDELEIVAFCEIDKFCQKVLKKHWPDVPIIEDVRELLCELKNKELPTEEISPSPKKQSRTGESFLNVNSAPSLFQFHRVLLNGAEDFVTGIAESKPCEEMMDQMHMEGIGCGAPQTPIIKMEQDTNGESDIKKQGFHNGEGGYSQGIITPVKIASSSQNKRISLDHTILKNGQNILHSDLNSQTASPFVNDATMGFIGEKQIDILTAGIPCQPASCAGKRKGKGDDRWLWGETFSIIRKIHPRWIILENVRGILSLERGVVFDNLLSELESYGYEVQPFIIPACAVNAPHRRDRVWIVAYTSRIQSGWEEQRTIGERIRVCSESIPQDVADMQGRESREQETGDGRKSLIGAGQDVADGIVNPKGATHGKNCDGGGADCQQDNGNVLGNDFGNGSQTLRWWSIEPDVGRVAHGIPSRVDRLKSLGNAIVPQVAVEIFRAIKAVEEHKED